MSQSLRVVSINTERTWRGGEGQTLALSEGLKRRGHATWVVGQPGSPMVERARAVGVEAVPVRMRGELDPGSVWRLRGVMKRLQPQIVHMHTSHAHTLGVLASLMSGVGRRVVSRRVDFSIHRHRFGLSGFKYRHGVDRYIAISTAVREQLVRDGIDPARISQVGSGVDPLRFQGGDAAKARHDLGVPEGAPLVGTIAHFGWHKSLETLIEAGEALLRRVPEAYVAIIGEGDLRPQLEEVRARSSARERILLPGFRPNVADFLAAFDVFVMPSVLEGLCTSILDAFAVGVPVTCSRAGGMVELVEHERTGLLFEPRDPAGLAAAAARLLSEAPLRERVVAEARRKLDLHYTQDAMVEGTLGVYRELLATGPSAEGRD